MTGYGPSVQPPLRKRREDEEVVVELLDRRAGWYPVKRFVPEDEDAEQ